MNETKEIKVTMNCEIELGADPVVNAETIKKAIAWGFEIIGADQQRMNLQYVNGHIFDKPSEVLADQTKHVALPKEHIPSVKISAGRIAKSKPATQERAQTAASCTFCEKPTRSDGKPCAGCSARVCSNCKVWPKGLCPKCHGSAERKPHTFKKGTPARPKNQGSDTLCLLCKKGTWGKKCPVCSKQVCFAPKCYDSVNDSCTECATIS